MHLAPNSCAAVLLALLAFTPAQEPAKPTVPAPKSGSAADAERIREGLLGAWRLVRAKAADETFSGGGCEGVMVVVDGYMSIHSVFESSIIRSWSSTGELFSAGTYRWRYDGDRLSLLTTGMLGVNNFNPVNKVQYEPPGVRREYRIDLVGDVLSLDRGNGEIRMEFIRLQPPEPAEVPAKKR